VALLAGPLQRMLDGVQALGPVARISGCVLTAELWGAEAPLWDNPLLQLELPAVQRMVEWREPPGNVAGHATHWLAEGPVHVRDPWHAHGHGPVYAWARLAAVDMVRNTRTVDHACLVAYAAAAPARAARAGAVLRGAGVRRLRRGALPGQWRGVLCRALFPDASLPVTWGEPDLLCERRMFDPLYTVAVVFAALPAAWVEVAGGAALTVLRPLRQFSPLPKAGERAAVVEILRLVDWQLLSVMTPAGWQRGRPGLPLHRCPACSPACEGRRRG
jgi:hypothetical protein